MVVEPGFDGEKVAPGKVNACLKGFQFDLAVWRQEGFSKVAANEIQILLGFFKLSFGKMNLSQFEINVEGVGFPAPPLVDLPGLLEEGFCLVPFPGIDPIGGFGKVNISCAIIAPNPGVFHCLLKAFQKLLSFQPPSLNGIVL